MTSSQTAGIDSLLKEIRKYTDRGSTVTSTSTSSTYASSPSQVSPGFEPAKPIPFGGQERSFAEPPRPNPAPRSPLQPPQDSKKVAEGIDDILAKISSVTGIRKESSDPLRSPAERVPATASVVNVVQTTPTPKNAAPLQSSPAQPNHLNNQPVRPIASADPYLPTKVVMPTQRSEQNDLSSRERYQAELARLDAEISRFKASMQNDVGSGVGKAARPEPAAVSIPKPPTSFSQPVTPKQRGSNSYLLHPDGDISQVGVASFEGAKEDLQKSISRMQEALKMSREMRAQLIPDTPTKPGERRASDSGSVRASPSVLHSMPVRSAPSPLPNAMAGTTAFGNGRPMDGGGVVPPWEQREEPPAASSWARRSPADAHGSSMAPPPEAASFYPGEPAAMHRDPYAPLPHDAAPMQRHAPPPPPPDAQRQPLPFQSSRPPLPDTSPQDMLQQRVQGQLRAEVDNYPVEQAFRMHLFTMIQDGSIRSSKELRAYIEQQLRSSAQPRPSAPPVNLSRSVDHGAPPMPRAYGSAAPQRGESDADILSRSFDEINRLASGLPPVGSSPYMAPPPRPMPTAQPGGYYNSANRGLSPMARPRASPSPMQPPMAPPDAFPRRPSQDLLHANPPFGLQRAPPPSASPRHGYPPFPHMPAPYPHRDQSPFLRDPSPFHHRPPHYAPPQSEDQRAYIPLSEVPQDIAASLISEGYSQGAML